MLMNRDDFEEKYKPIYPSEDAPYWETYGEDLAYVRRIAEINPRNVLTVVDPIDDTVSESGLIIIPGYWPVDMIGYIVVENEYLSEQEVEY